MAKIVELPAHPKWFDALGRLILNITATLIGQMITFALFIWFTMKFVWPPLTKALQRRQEKIADGLAAGERGQKELTLAQQKATGVLREAKTQAVEITDNANRRAGQIIEQAKINARDEGKRLIARAAEDIEQAVNQAKENLRKHIATIAISGAERILQTQVDVAANNHLMDQLITEIDTQL